MSGTTDRTVSFEATIQARTEKATAIAIPSDVLETLGPAKRPRLRVIVNEHSYEARVGIMKGEYLIPLSAEARRLAGVSAGDTVEVQVALAPEG